MRSPALILPSLSPPSRRLAAVPSSSSIHSLLPMLPSRPFLLLPPPSSRFGPPTHVRPIDLPDDVLLCIFERLSHARDIAAVRGVCLAWRTLVDHTETIWRSLVFELPRCARTAHHAETWYRKAADYGNSQAQFMLALLYTYGYSGHQRGQFISDML